MKCYFRMALWLLFVPALARAQFRFAGKIEYERKTNLHRLYDGEEWFEGEKGSIPNFYTSYSDLVFDSTASRYQPGREAGNEKLDWLKPPGAENIIFRNFRNQTVQAQKQVFEQTFQISDSAQRYRWKIGSAVRTIAGYTCRKAVTIICDSVYVVAFYAEDIPVSGGPEQVGGLPGMILELAVPRLQTTWIATKVEAGGPTAAQLAPPSGKGKKVTYPEMLALLQTGLKDWGKWGHRNIWWAML